MITFYAPINDLGYGVHAFNFMKALTAAGLALELITPTGRVDKNSPLIEGWIAGTGKQEELGFKNPAVMIYHEQFLRQFSGSPRIGFPVFELEKLTYRALMAIQSCDYVLQPTLYGRQVLVKAGITKPIYIVNEGFDPGTFYPMNTVEEMESILDQEVRFVHVGKMEARKSTEEIIHAFTKASEGLERKTVLTLKIANPFLQWEVAIQALMRAIGWTEQMHTANAWIWKKERSKIVIFKPNLQDQAELAKMIYGESHFGIWASKAEGWNLPLMEAVACGVPSFTTPWTGMSEYVTKQAWGDEFLFEKHEKRLADDRYFFRGDRGDWRCPDVEEMAAKIKTVMIEPRKFYAPAREKQMQAVRGFTWDNAAKQFMKFMKQEGIAL